MSENQLLSVLTTFLQQKGNNLKNNELFGILSLMLLLEITHIFKMKIGSVSGVTNEEDTNTNLPALNNVTSLVNQLQGNNGTSNNIQQLLPLLMGALGGNNSTNNSPDLNSLLSMVNSISSLQSKKEEKENKEEKEQSNKVEETENLDKKKIRLR